MTYPDSLPLLSTICLDSYTAFTGENTETQRSKALHSSCLGLILPVPIRSRVTVGKVLTTLGLSFLPIKDG